ncbi:NADP-dependent 3-hydroxy acid dehydrogenase YdfG [Nocardioides luteus]|uniref:Short-chain dehydrogenase n=1 Tax=Nocardioides luteus TaxID=1844 RepID=A0ABQ5T1B4_9ACTN|nr:SDR family oxidoreductase [Nocardioides luteus]MDR7310692.1 NADP-dependent 3-hydroxy acid dehydrogenase YdfG [Nocardioides luteus]GGR41222.1 short-chain dehydrogenase [Nocardioides luteus]GLJ69527.1 short-chain dehydrogenase [Nocardioides luteus]
MSASEKYAQPDRRPAVVTGASSGIGAETARALAAAGLPVALGARRVGRVEEIAAAIRADGGEAVAHPLDVTSDDSVAEFAAKVTADLGEVEVVVSNAGVTHPGATVDVTTEDFADQIDVNLLGSHRLLRAFAPGMIERRRGDLVFLSSDVAVRPRPFMGAYAASKWGLEGMVNALRMELEGTGVRASLVRPGPTHSDIGNEWPAELGGFVLEQWVRWGLARHPHFLEARALADAITTVVTAARGVHISTVDVDPEAPIETLVEEAR